VVRSAYSSWQAEAPAPQLSVAEVHQPANPE
jgi:hypothetical protein